jgi:hypothetical protein
VENLYERSKAYNIYQDDLDMERTNFDSVLELRFDYNLKNDMWVALHEWGPKSAAWCQTQFAEIDVKNISAEVERYYKIASKSRVL